MGSLVQSQDKENPFFESENNDKLPHSEKNTNTPSESGSTENKPGDPPNTLPIDNFIPFLLVTALGIIIYQVRKQKQAQ